MNLYLIAQKENDNYDTYDSAVVAAETEEKARLMNFGYFEDAGKEGQEWLADAYWTTDRSKVTVELIGLASPGTVSGLILGSYNAG